MAFIKIDVFFAATQLQASLVVGANFTIEKLALTIANELGLPSSCPDGTPQLYTLILHKPDGSEIKLNPEAGLADQFVPPGSLFEILPTSSQLISIEESEQLGSERLTSDFVELCLRYKRPLDDTYEQRDVQLDRNSSADQLCEVLVRDLKLPTNSDAGTSWKYHLEIVHIAGSRRRLAGFEKPASIIGTTQPEGRTLYLLGEPEPIADLKEVWREVFDEDPNWMQTASEQEQLHFDQPATAVEIASHLDALVEMPADSYFLPLAKVRSLARTLFRMAGRDEAQLVSVAIDLRRMLEKLIKSAKFKPRTIRRKRTPPPTHAAPDERIPTVAIITALPVELVPMWKMLDNLRNAFPNQLDPLRRSQLNTHWLGDVPAANDGVHHVLLSLLSTTGTNGASAWGTNLLNHWPSVHTIIMVGIAGGVPCPENPDEHVRLGDIVTCNERGVVQYDFIRQLPDEIIERPPPRPPSPTLLHSARILAAKERTGDRPWMAHLRRVAAELKIRRPPDEFDVLHSSLLPYQSIPHPVDPKRKKGVPRIFSGPIASANVLLKDPNRRDQLRDKYGIEAVEMETSGVAEAAYSVQREYFVVRGVSDNCDGFKNDVWQPYSSVVAAAFARTLLEEIPCA